MAYIAKQNVNSLLESSGSFALSETVLCTYMDLDRLIDACRFAIRQLRMLKRLMAGATIVDIAQMENQPVERVERDFRNIVSRITRQHRKNWIDIHARKSASCRK